MPVKSFIMDGRVVVGVGNIYANESLYLSGIHPQRACGRISLARYQRLESYIRQVLRSVKNFAALFVASAFLAGLFLHLARSLQWLQVPGAERPLPLAEW